VDGSAIAFEPCPSARGQAIQSKLGGSRPLYRTSLAGSFSVSANVGSIGLGWMCSGHVWPAARHGIGAGSKLDHVADVVAQAARWRAVGAELKTRAQRSNFAHLFSHHQHTSHMCNPQQRGGRRSRPLQPHARPHTRCGADAWHVWVLALCCSPGPSCCFGDAEINEEADAGVKLARPAILAGPLFEACDTANQTGLPRAASLHPSPSPLVRGITPPAPAPNLPFPGRATKEQCALLDVTMLLLWQPCSVYQEGRNPCLSYCILSICFCLSASALGLVPGEGRARCRSGQSNRRRGLVSIVVAPYVVLLDMIIGYIRRNQTKQSW
jgi:hypothetical protein